MREAPLIIFVCEHGAAKSILAAAHFNSMAAEQGLDVRAIARGTNPDQEISEQIKRELSMDGLAPTESTPQKLSLDEMSTAQYLVSFCELPVEYEQDAVIEQWDGIPATSENYEQAREAILVRLDRLINNIRRLP